MRRHLVLAFVLLLTGWFGLPAAADEAPGGTSTPEPVDVYATMGEHHVNGRDWRTDCEPYSQTIRCRTEIKADTVVEVDGRFVKTHDWVFNNLTYLASPHALWAGNPLARPGERITPLDQRMWRTVCHSPETGNACRTYVQAKYIEANETADGWRYGWSEGWVFNNIVRFSDPYVAPEIDLYS